MLLHSSRKGGKVCESKLWSPFKNKNIYFSLLTNDQLSLQMLKYYEKRNKLA